MSTQSNHRLHPEKEQLVVMHLGDADKLLIISSLKQFLISCFGPQGKAKYIRNRHGALMALTASSNRLIPNLTLVSPISQIITTSIQQHLSAYSDNGLFMGILMLSLIEGALRDGIHHMICCEVYTVLMQRCLDDIEGSVIKVNLSDMKAMLCLVRSVFRSKTSCCLKSDEIKLLSSLTLQILTSAIPDDDESMSLTIPSIEYVTIAGQPVTATQLVNGVLLDVPKYKSISFWINKFGRAPLRVAVFNTSLDIDSAIVEGVTLEVDRDVDLEEYTTQQMIGLALRLQALGVNVVGCQKVVHPTLVKILSRHQILCLEKLSIVHIESVQKLTGACLLSSMNCDITANSLGHLEGIDWYKGLNQRWLHLTNERRVNTVILCHRNGTCLQELKHVFGVAYHVASLTISDPDVVPGRGVFEDQMASRIREKLPVISKDVCARIHCSSVQFYRAADVFLNGLHGIATSLNPSTSHSVSHQSISEESPARVAESSQTSNPAVNPEHGSIEDSLARLQPPIPQNDEKSVIIDWDNDVVDLLVVKRNAFKMAVEMANMILSIGIIVGSSDM